METSEAPIVTDEQAADTERRALLAREFIRPIIDQLSARCKEFGIGFTFCLWVGPAGVEDGVVAHRYVNGKVGPPGVTMPRLMLDIDAVTMGRAVAVTTEGIDSLIGACLDTPSGSSFSMEPPDGKCDCAGCVALRAAAKAEDDRIVFDIHQNGIDPATFKIVDGAMVVPGNPG